MSEKPILFCAPMIKYILDGSKTQTRRVVKLKNGFAKNGATISVLVDQRSVAQDACPYGKIGDELWVRETHSFCSQLDDMKASDLGYKEPVYYHADNSVRVIACSMIEKGKNRPSIFMPRWASRIQLRITDVRVERLNGISEEDAIAEGIKLNTQARGINYTLGNSSLSVLAGMFAYLWESINGKTIPWANNPWVWVVEFEVKP